MAFFNAKLKFYFVDYQEQPEGKTSQTHWLDKWFLMEPGPATCLISIS
jgi:hypothetical protein